MRGLITNFTTTRCMHKIAKQKREETLILILIRQNNQVNMKSATKKSNAMPKEKPLAQDLSRVANAAMKTTIERRMNVWLRKEKCHRCL